MTGKEKTILVLEDELPLQRAIRTKLEKYDFQVVTARTVEQAENHLKDIKGVNAIWVDHYLLGKETGFDFVNKLKSGKKWRGIPVFVVSNTASEKKVGSYMSLGVEKYYTKSDYRLEQIIKDICKTLDKKE